MEAYLGNIHKNIMGTTSFDLRIKGMRKNQEFIVYPLQSGEQSKEIKIQSSTRIGYLNLETGRGRMSASHQSGAYFIHLQLDTLTEFQLRNVDNEALRLFIFTTAGSKVGERHVVCDNSSAINVMNL